MGVDRQSPAGHASRTSEGRLSLDSEQALPCVNDGGATSDRVPGAGRHHQAAAARRPGAGRALALDALAPAAPEISS
jgi:hypothetical protein